MEHNGEILNKVAESGLITIDLEDFHDHRDAVVFDIKQCLWMEVALKEKDFRDFLKAHDWTYYTDKNVAIVCTADAIVPTWAYMLVASRLKPYANRYVFGDVDFLISVLYNDAIDHINVEKFRDKKIVIKGCGKYNVPISAYVKLTDVLLNVSSSIMFGEPCSTVPIYKRAR